MKMIGYNQKTTIIFTVISGFGSFMFFLLSVLLWHNSFEWLAMGHNGFWELGDFFRVVTWGTEGMKNVYQFQGDIANLPALAIVLLHIFWRINVVPFEKGNWISLMNADYELWIFVGFMMISAILFLLAVASVMKMDTNATVILTISILLSYPFFAGAIEKGNIAFQTLILIIFALVLKDSEKLWKRELALILIALAAGIKIYPAILGILYVKEKRVKETIRLIIYGIIAFFAPFLFTGDFWTWFGYLRQYVNDDSTRWVSVYGFINDLALKSGQSAAAASAVGKVASYVFLVMMICMTFVASKKWKTLLYVCMIIACFPATAFLYQLIYLIVPALFMLREHKEQGTLHLIDYLYTILFGLGFTIHFWWWFGEAEHWVCVVMYTVLTISIIEDIQLVLQRKMLLSRSDTNEIEEIGSK